MSRRVVDANEFAHPRSAVDVEWGCVYTTGEGARYGAVFDHYLELHEYVESLKTVRFDIASIEVFARKVTKTLWCAQTGYSSE